MGHGADSGDLLVGSPPTYPWGRQPGHAGPHPPCRPRDRETQVCPESAGTCGDGPSILLNPELKVSVGSLVTWPHRGVTQSPGDQGHALVTVASVPAKPEVRKHSYQTRAAVWCGRGRAPPPCTCPQQRWWVKHSEPLAIAPNTQLQTARRRGLPPAGLAGSHPGWGQARAQPPQPGLPRISPSRPPSWSAQQGPPPHSAAASLLGYSRDW